MGDGMKYRPIYIDEKSYDKLRKLSERADIPIRRLVSLLIRSMNIDEERDKPIIYITINYSVLKFLGDKRDSWKKELEKISDISCREFIKMLIEHNLLNMVKKYLRGHIDILDGYISDDGYIMIHRYRKQILGFKYREIEKKPKKLIYIL